MNLDALLSKFEALFVPVTKAPESDAVKVLTDVYERIGAMLTKVQESNGQMPEGLGAEITTAAGMLLSLTPGQAPGANATTPAGVPAAAPATTHLAQPGTVPLVLSAATKRDLASRLSKAELDAYTARIATMNAANERWWKMRNLFDQGKDAEANVEMKGIAEMLTNASQTAPAAPAGELPAEKREVTFTPEAFTAYAIAEVQKAAKEEKEPAAKRLVHLRELNKLAKAWFFEGTQPGLPWKVEIATAYAPEGDGKPLDLTTKADQSQTTGNLLGGNPGTQMGSIFKAETLEKVDAALGEMLAQVGGAPAPAANPEGTPVAKAGPPDADFLWPSDLAAMVKAEDEEAAAKKRGIQKSAALADGDFGKDPWHPTRQAAR